MGYTVYYSDPVITSKAGFGRVARLPCIFDTRPGYHRLGSQYLIDRGLGVWNPETRGKSPRATAPSEQTLKNYAHWLANFLEWAERRGVDVQTCDYSEHVQGRYQSEMLDGRWSRDATGLSPQTVNLRVQQGCDFLTWMADKGHRQRFDVPHDLVKVRVGSATSSIGHRAKEVAVRKGKVRQDKRRLRMPTDEQVKKWLAGVYDKFGETKGLMCETILCTGMRREEVACWRIDTLPADTDKWHLNRTDAHPAEQQVLVEIKFGTKGTNYGRDHGDKIGPARSIWIPRHLAERLHDYRSKRRHRALQVWVRSASTAAEQKVRRDSAVHLFLDEESGERVASKNLYNAWTGVVLPFKGWCPHLGRDWWACSVLWREMKKHEHIRSLGVDIAAALLESTAMSIIRLQIQPQLGHAHDSTSLIYLVWIKDMLSVGIPRQYETAGEPASRPE